MFPKIYTVSELTSEIKTKVESDFPQVWVEGEISNYTLHNSGHRYFSLKDEGALIRCVFWRWQARFLRFEPENGMQIQVYGNLTVYEKQGQYQLNVLRILPKGIGELELAFQQLKAKLFYEGLFDLGHKRSLPRFPESIGIVTSPTSAAIRDLIKILKKRYPLAKVILYPASVQGREARDAIVTGIEAFNRYGQVDLIIVGRGGGSIEDLWAFNEEAVARAIYNSKIPVVSAVGHEIDYTIADFVADLRAPTPSAAAALVVPDQREVLVSLYRVFKQLWSESGQRFIRIRQRLQRATSSYGFRRPLDLISQHGQRVDEATRVLRLRIEQQVKRVQSELALLIAKLETLSPLSIFRRGYSMTRKLPDLKIVKEVNILQIEDQVEVTLFRGRFVSTVKNIEQG